MSATFPVKIICPCGRRLVPFFAAVEHIRFLQQHGAKEDLLLATVKCQNPRCGQVHAIRLGQVSGRVAA